MVFLWLCPFFYAGWTNNSYFRSWPRLSFQYSAAGLFTHRTDSWTQHLFQVQFAGSANWVTVDTEALSPMGAFGCRQRLDRILFEAHRANVVNSVRLRMANWIVKRGAQLFPSHDRIEGVRVVRTFWKAGSPALAAPEGRWLVAPFEGLPRAQTQVLVTYRVDQGLAVLVKPPKVPRSSRNIGDRFARRGEGGGEAKGPSTLVPGVNQSAAPLQSGPASSGMGLTGSPSSNSARIVAPPGTRNSLPQRPVILPSTVRKGPSTVRPILSSVKPAVPPVAVPPVAVPPVAAQKEAEPGTKP